MNYKLLIIVLLTVLGSGCRDTDRENTHPNIIIILADDMGYGDLSCYNAESRISTPNMDRLAEEGIRFTDAHSADAVCTSSRYGLMTGRYCWRTRLKRSVLFNYEPPLIEKGRMTIASLLADNGYRTGMVGKWHLGLGYTAKAGKTVDFNKPLPWYLGPRPDSTVGQSIDFSAKVFGGPNDLGFDYSFYTSGCSADQEPYCFIENKKFLHMQNASYRHPSGSWRWGMAAPDWVNETVDLTFTEKATAFISSSHKQNKDKPFFLYLALSAPHSPHLIPEFARGKSEAGVRGDMVWLVDWSVGKILQTLEELGISDNTLIMVSSDNGPLRGSLAPGVPEGTAKISNGHKSAGSFRAYKASIFEGGHRVPFIARWPGHIPAGQKNDEAVCHIDLLASFAALTGSSLPEKAGEDSETMLPAFFGKALKSHRHIIHHSNHKELALRNGRWKLIRKQNEDMDKLLEDSGMLFDIEEDPYEKEDLWIKYPEIADSLEIVLDQFIRPNY